MNLSLRILAPLSLAFIAATGCVSGSAIVTGTKRAPIQPDQVVLYLEAPEKFEVIGLVTASSDTGFSEQKAVDNAVRELKNQAGRLGANGLILSPAVGSETKIVGNFVATTKTVQGKAIFVESTN